MEQLCAPAGFVRRTDERGLSLLELLIALSVFAVMILGIVATVDSGLNLSRNNRNRSVAANLASQEMDLVRTSDFLTLAPATTLQEVDGVAYTVYRELTWIPKDATNGPCDGSGGNPQLLRVRVRVTWPNMRGVKSARSDTVLSPPVGAYDPNTGHIAVKVLDRDAAPSFASVVSVTGPTSQSLPTNSEGCAFFAFLPPGTYTVALGTAGYVDRQGSATPSQVVGVDVGVTSSVQFDYDRAASLDLTFVSDAGGVVPNDLPLTVANTAFVPSGTKVYPGSGEPRAVTDLFPSLDGYQVWAGECADADPEGQMVGGTGPYWPDVQRDPQLAPPPAGTAAGTVRLETVQLGATQLDVPLVSVSLVATHAPDHVCGAAETHTLGATGADGLLDVALPYGTWEISIEGFEPEAGMWPQLVVDPTDPATASLVVEAL